MTHFKQLKPQLLSQENGILHVGRGQTSDSKDFGVIGEHGGIFSGFVRSAADKTFYLFDSLTSSPYGQDTVNKADSSFKTADLNLAQLTGTKAVINDSSGAPVVTIDLNGVNANAVTGTSSVTGGNVKLSNASIATTNTNGDLTLAPNGSGQVLIQSAPSAANSAATKTYVDSVVAGLDVKASVRAYATDPNILSTTVANPNIIAGSDATKTITAGVNGAIPAASFDGVSLNLGDRVLVNVPGSSEVNNVYQGDLSNGIYTVTTVGDASHPWVLTRAPDAATDDDLTSGAFTFVTEGTVYGATGWVLSTADPITVDTTDLRFTQFSSAGVLYANSTGTGAAVYSNQQGEELNFRSIAASAQSNPTSVLETSVSTDGKTVDITFDQSKITGTGTLTSGSISWSGDVSTTGTVHGGTAVTSGGGITAVDDISTTSGAVKGASVSATAGDVTASGNVSTTNGGVSGNTVTATTSVTGATLKTATGGVSIADKTVTLADSSKIALAAATTTALSIGNGTSTIATFDTTNTALVVATGSKIVLPTTAPTDVNQAVSKSYVDTAVANAEVVGHSEGTGTPIFDATASGGHDVYIKSLAVAAGSTGAGGLITVDGTTNANTVTVTVDQSKITGTGALASGSIATGFGAIATTNAISGSSVTASGTVSGATVETTDGTVALTSKTLTFSSGSTVDMGAGSATSLVFTDGTNTYATFDTTGKSVTFGESVNVPTPTASTNATTKGYVDSAITNATININDLDTSTGAYNIYQSTSSSVNGPTLNLRALRYYDVTAGSGTATDGTTIAHNTSVPLEIAKSTNDNDITFNFDQTLIKTVGALGAGSINWTGSIATTDKISYGLGLYSAGATAATGGTYLDANGNVVFVGGDSSNTWNVYDQNGKSLLNISNSVAPNAQGSFPPGGVVSTSNSTLDDGGGGAIFGGQVQSTGFHLSDGSIQIDTSKIGFYKSGAANYIGYGNDATLNFGVNAGTGQFILSNANSGSATFNVALTGVELSTTTVSHGNIDLKDAKITFTDSGAGQAEIVYGTDFTISDAGGKSLEFTNSDATFYMPLKTDAGVNAAFGGGIQYSVQNVSANKTVDSTAYIYRVDATSGNITITLPAAADPGSVGRGYRFIRVDSSSNTVTVTPSGTDHLDGIVDNFALQAQYDHAEVICDGVDGWFMF